MTIDNAYDFVKSMLTEMDGIAEFKKPIDAVINDPTEGEITLEFDSCNIEDGVVLFWSGGRDYKREDFTELGLVKVLTEARKTIQRMNGQTHAQYRVMKDKHPDRFLLFRVGDFYETYYEDAVDANKILGITLTKHNNMELAGFPYHALDIYLPKLIRAGRRVAICDSLEDPITIKRSRGITAIHR